MILAAWFAPWKLPVDFECHVMYNDILCGCLSDSIGVTCTLGVDGFVCLVFCGIKQQLLKYNHHRDV